MQYQDIKMLKYEMTLSLMMKDEYINDSIAHIRQFICP